MQLPWIWSSFRRTSWLHRVARLFDFRPYAVFPGPRGLRVLVYLVYAHAPSVPRALVVGESWADGHTAEELLSGVGPEAADVREATQEAADRLACPATAVLYLHTYYPRPRLPTVQIPGVTLLLSWCEYSTAGELPPAVWSLPRRTGRPELPPYPFRPLSDWPLEQWEQGVEAARRGDAQQPLELSRSLAERALECLKEASALPGGRSTSREHPRPRPPPAHLGLRWPSRPPLPSVDRALPRGRGS